jgi:cytochrome bd-type quinol oxidase subunit 2
MNTGLFIAGVLVTLIVVVAMGLLIWGLRMEAQRNARRSAGADDAARSASPPSERVSAQGER